MKSIALKLWLGMMSLVAFMLLLLWLFQVVFLENFYTNMRLSEVRNSAKSALGLLESNPSDFAKNMDLLSYNHNISIELWDSKNSLIYAGGPSGGSGQMPMGRNSIKLDAQRKVLSSSEVTVEMTHPRFGNKFMLIGLPFQHSTGERYGLMLTVPLAPIAETAAILKKQLFLIILISLGCTMLLSFLLSKSFTKPLLNITKVAVAISKGNFAEKVSIQSQDEIGHLGQTINDMSLELSKTDALRKELISNVSHELRTPLSIIRGYAETIRDVTGDNPPKRTAQASVIIEESERLSALVDDILNLSQLQSGNITLDMKPFLIKDTLHRVLNTYEIEREKNGIDVILEEVPSCHVVGDEKRIEQVLFNLLNNAFNHTPSGGKITIETSLHKELLKIQVSDTGHGISEEDIRHIWDRYYKSYRENSRRQIGTGLGLSIVKNILDAHDAPYGVQSRLKQGTTFWFCLMKG